MLVLPAGHPWSTRASVRRDETAEVDGLPLPRWPCGDDGAPGPEVRDHGQLLQLISLGRACAVLPDSVRAGLSSSLVAVPVEDAAPVTTVIAWPPHSRSRAVADLVRTATRL